MLTIWKHEPTQWTRVGELEDSLAFSVANSLTKDYAVVINRGKTPEPSAEHRRNDVKLLKQLGVYHPDCPDCQVVIEAHTALACDNHGNTSVHAYAKCSTPSGKYAGMRVVPVCRECNRDNAAIGGLCLSCVGR